MIAHLIQKQYFIKYDKKLRKHQSDSVVGGLNLIIFSASDVFSHIWLGFILVRNVICMNICCQKEEPSRTYLSRSKLLYHSGFDKIQQQLCIGDLLVTIQKLKAGLAAVIDHNTRKVEDT